jgi:phosphodiesterase/alkaline phosphatase D-like protein
MKQRGAGELLPAPHTKEATMKITNTILLLLMLALAGRSQAAADSANANQGLQIVQGPSVEKFDERSAIITWSTNTNGSSSVHYGSKPANLDQLAASPNRWSRNLPNMVHRVLLLNLKPSTTYYYVVDSNGVKSPVSHFVTRVKQ